MRNILLLLMICLVSISAHTQVGISMGPIVQHGFGTKKVFGGLNLGVEIPRNENSSFIARIYGTLKTTYQDSTYAEAKAGVTPSVLMVDMKNGVSTYGIEGGMRRYFMGTNFDDYGFSLYGGSIFSLSFYRLSSKLLDPIDENSYTLPSRSQGSVIMLNFGLQGGMKKQFTWGNLFLDLSLTYAILATGSSNYTPGSKTSFSSLNFFAMLGYRRDIYWK